jgi:hypothetical protein
MLFHFQFLGEAGWEPVGAGIGEGDDPITSALDEIRELSAGALPAGRYQVIEARGSDTRWQTFDLGSDGNRIDCTEEPPARRYELRAYAA